MGRIATQAPGHRQVVLAAIDRDSLLAPAIGPIAGLRYTADDFRARDSTAVDLVAIGACAGVRKRLANRWRFLCELRAHHALAGAGCNVPALLDADFDALTITTAWIPGRVLTGELARRCLAARDRDCGQFGPVRGVRGRARWKARVAEMRRALYDVVPPEFGRRVREQVERIHAARVIWGDVKYGNIVIAEDTGQPWLVDFDYSGYLPRLMPAVFEALCDEERARCAWHFPEEGGDASASLGPSLRSA